MTWLEWVLLGSVGAVLFGSGLFRLVAGYRCPACQQRRMRYVGVLHETHVGMRSLWACPRCGGRFVEGNWGKMEREPPLELGDDGEKANETPA